MRDRPRPPWAGGRPASPSRSLAFLLLLTALLAAVAFSSFRLLGVPFHPTVITKLRDPVMNVVSSDEVHSSQDSNNAITIHIQEAVSFPDQVLLFLKQPYRHTTSPIPSFHCLYFPPSSPRPNLRLPVISSTSGADIIRCPLAPDGFAISLSASPPLQLPPVQPHRWDHLAYTALLDRDNSTIVFAKGINLRPARLSDPSRYQCLYGWDFSNPKYLLTSVAFMAAQEVIRCKTPLSVLLRMRSANNPPMVSVSVKGRGGFTLPSVARPESFSSVARRRKKKYTMCVCTMIRNQARFLREWITYHHHIGVERWFIYDNDSDDGIEQVIKSLRSSAGYNVTRHPWPWLKTQEGGFAHCALRARDSCEWVGFIDVDEFFYLPSNVSLHGVLQNYSGQPHIGELRSTCHSFGPSGRKTAPPEGVMVGYTCRMAAPERHKSIIRPEALNPSLINVVHHFHLKHGIRYVNLETKLMVINHYKYQVWEVFKEKFYRRVATYVADWQDDENTGSKDRAPGLGTKAVEPPDWPRRFCEVNDIGLRDWVRQAFADPDTGRLPW